MPGKQERVIELQRAVKIARAALERISCGLNPTEAERLARDTLDKMWPLAPKQPLQGLVGHASRKEAP